VQITGKKQGLGGTGPAESSLLFPKQLLLFIALSKAAFAA